MKNPKNAQYIILLDQLIGHGGLNTMLNMAVAADPNRGVAYSKVAAPFLASRPLTLVLLVGIFCSQNPPMAVKITSILGSNQVPMNVFGENIFVHFLLVLFSLGIEVIVN